MKAVVQRVKQVSSSAVIVMIVASLAYALFVVIVKGLLNKGIGTVSVITSMAVIMIPVLLFYLLTKRKQLDQITFLNWKRMILIGILATFLGRILQIFGQSMTSANNAGFIIKLSVLTTIIFAYFLIKERLSRMIIFSALLMLVGVLILSTNFTFTFVNLGDAVLVLLAILIGYTNTLAKKITRSVNPYILSTVRLFVGNLIFLVVFPCLFGLNIIRILFEYPLLVSLAGLLGIVFIFSLYKGIELTGPSRATTLFLLSAVFTPILSYMFLGENLTTYQLIGGLLILIGAFFVAREKEGVRYIERKT